MNIAGLPVEFTNDGSGFIVQAVFQNVYINGSPLVVYLDPPVASESEVNAPALLLALLAALANGAVIGL